MARKRKAGPPGPHIFWRTQQDGPPRAYGDFRAIPGGGREALIPPGEPSATTDPTTAQEIFARRLRALEDHQSSRAAGSPQGRKTTIAQAVAAFVEYKRGRKRATGKWVAEVEKMLGRAVEHFGPTRRLASIGPEDLVEWLDALATAKHERGAGYSDQTRRHHLNAISQLFKRGWRKGWVALGYSPTRLLESEERPAIPESTTGYLEVPDAARLLEAARTYPKLKSEPRMVMAYPVIGTFLLTGARLDEVLGLSLSDLDFKGKRIHFRPNEHRSGKKGKTATSNRTVPMFPQLEEILTGYLEGPFLDMRLRRPDLTLLFPSPVTLQRIRDIRDLVDKVAARAGLPVGVFRQREFRVTYITARLQTLDRGEPIAIWTVAKEAGHASTAMIERVYGRLGTVRHRSEVVEFRVVPNTSANAGPRVSPLVTASGGNF